MLGDGMPHDPHIEQTKAQDAQQLWLTRHEVPDAGTDASAHVVLGEDMMVGGMGKGGDTVLNTDGWKERLGVSSVAPSVDEELADMTIDLEVFREYAKAVGAATDEFLTNATDEQLAKEIGSAKQPLITVLANIGVPHIAEHWGEIAALKGVQGLKGLPF